MFEGAEFPYPLEYLWGWFHELNAGRGGTGFGPAKIGWADIMAWAQLTGNVPEPWEAFALMRLDVAYINAMSEKPEKT